MTAPRLIQADQLRALVGYEDLIEPVSRAFQESSAGLAQHGLITMYPAERPDLGDVYVKAGSLSGHRVFVVKVSPWFAMNRDQGGPQGGLVAVFDADTGYTMAVLAEEHYLSDIRTAAAGALAARALANAEVDCAAVLGAGTQAYWQPQALFRERPFRTLVIWARRAEQAEELARRLRPHLPGAEIQTSDDIEQTVSRADVLITATSARDPLVQGEWLHPGQHITAVGADDATKCELDANVLRRSRVFVDSIEVTAAHGDVARAISRDEYELQQLAGEIGEVLAGSKVARLSKEDITVAKFVGIGPQDLVAAEVSLDRLGILTLSTTGPRRGFAVNSQ